jgi:hypothetical protein
MRRLLVVSVLLVLAVGVAGCARPGRPGDPLSDPAASSAGSALGGADAREAEVYVQVLRQYLTTPNDNSFPDRSFKTVYALDQAYPDAGDPVPGKEVAGVPISDDVQRYVVAALAKDGVELTFAADRNSVLDDPDGCPKVRNGGILITLGTLKGDDNPVQVGVSGFVACLGATWLTYVVKNEPGTGWRVTGTTGPRAIA